MSDGQPMSSRSLVDRVTQHGVWVTIVAPLVVAALIGAAVVAYKTVSAPSEAEAAMESLSRLTIGMSVDRFRDELGTAYATHRFQADGTWNENIWITPLYAVQTVSDTAGSVALYSLTTRDASFSPPDKLFGHPLGQRPISRYDHLALDETVSAWKGPGADWWYSEGHYLGGAGDDKTVVLTASAADFGQRAAGTIHFPDVLCNQPLCPVPPHPAKLDFLRSRLKATTFTLADEDALPLRSLPPGFRFGPDWDLVSGFDSGSSDG